jgi:hypothetical protein
MKILLLLWTTLVQTTYGQQGCYLQGGPYMSTTPAANWNDLTELQQSYRGTQRLHSLKLCSVKSQPDGVVLFAGWQTTFIDQVSGNLNVLGYKGLDGAAQPASSAYTCTDHLLGSSTISAVKVESAFSNGKESVNYIEFQSSSSGKLFSVGDETQSNGSRTTLAIPTTLVGLQAYGTANNLETVGFIYLNSQCNCLNTELLSQTLSDMVVSADQGTVDTQLIPPFSDTYSNIEAKTMCGAQKYSLQAAGGGSVPYATI